MKIFLGNNENNDSGIFRLNKTQRNRQSTSRGERKRDLMQERVAAHEREMRMRETEDKRISKLNEEIFRVEESEMSDEAKKLTIAMLNEQINSIFMTRAEREQAAIEREMQRQQQEMEERMRERERLAQESQTENKTEEELQAAAERSAVRGLTAIGTRLDNISSLKRTRASMNAEATRLRGEGDFDKSFVRQSNQKIIAHASATGASVSFLFGGNSSLSADTFKGRHLINLGAGISRLTSNINHQVSSLYRDSQKLQEEQLRIYREKARVPSQQDDDDEEQHSYENNSFDMRL